MSWPAMKWAVEQAPILTSDAGRRNSSAAHVLQILAYHADTDGVAWPSPERLEQETGLGTSAVRDALTALEDGGLVEREVVDGVTRWRLQMDRQRDVPIQQEIREKIERRQEQARLRQAKRRGLRSAASSVTPESNVTVTLNGGVTDDDVTLNGNVMSRWNPENVTLETNVTHIRNEQSVEQPLEPPAPRTRRRRTPDPAETINGFADFWAAYPKRGGRNMAKDDARKAWGSTLKAIRKPDDDGKTWTVEQIVAGARRYAVECESLRDRQFVSMPASWLRAGRWKYDDNDLSPVGRDPREFLRDCWRKSSVREIHRFFTSGYVQPPAGDGDYVTTVLEPYNRRWIEEHETEILARLAASEAS